MKENRIGTFFCLLKSVRFWILPGISTSTKEIWQQWAHTFWQWRKSIVVYILPESLTSNPCLKSPKTGWLSPWQSSKEGRSWGSPPNLSGWHDRNCAPSTLAIWGEVEYCDECCHPNNRNKVKCDLPYFFLVMRHGHLPPLLDYNPY